MDHGLQERLGVISRRAVIWWTAGSYLGVGIFSFPRDAVRQSGFGAAYAFAAEMILLAVSAWILLALMRRHPGMTTVQIAIESMGWFGRIFAFPVGLIMLLTLSEAYRFLADVMRETSLQRTPLWAIEAIAAAAVAYMASLGVVAMSRTLQVLSPVLLAVGLGLYVLTLGGVRSYFLIPHWTGWQAVAAGAYMQFFIFAGLQNVHIFHAFVGRSRVGRSVAYGLALNAAVLLFLFIGAVGTFGIDAMRDITWPGPFLEKSVSLHGFYVRRLGFFTFLAGVGWVVTFLAVTSLLTSIGYSQVIGLRASDFRIVLPFVIVIPVVAALLIPDEAVAQWLAARWLAPLTLFAVVVEPIVLWAAEAVHARRTRSRAGPASV